MRGFLHLSVWVLALTTIGASPAAPPQGVVPATGDATFVIMVKGVRVGTENDTLSHSASGWRIVATNQQAQADAQTSVFDLSYDGNWSPQALSVRSTLRGQPVRFTTTFAGTTATNVITSATDSTKTSTVSHTISDRAVIVPAGFYGAYEALAVRLATMAVGDSVTLYLAPDSEVRVTVNAIEPRRIATPRERLMLREFDLTVQTGVPQPLQVWVDERNRLAQVFVPTASLTVAREDIATVMAREEHVTNAGDTATFLPMLGFTVGATITAPATTARHAAVVLVPGFGTQDRDMVVAGVPVFGLLAGGLADAGNVVVRYDRRGVGQSGGRTENATLEDYRDDLIQVVSAIRKRKDVDPDRVAVIGYQEGGAVALLAAAKDDDIKAVGLVAVPGSTGRDYVMEEQARALAALRISDEDRASKIRLQRQAIDAALSGTGWDLLPADVSHEADQPIFKSWLLFDPIKAMSKVDQPVLIVQGLADADVPQAHADRLLAAARARKRPPTATQSALLPAVAHTLTPASSSSPTTLAPEAVAAVTGWLRSILGHGK
jgi:pimeloyl-ACP methyl ester carboxylesterase